MENATPMLRQYQEIKHQYKDWILFFRLGDFYEMFYDDAKQASSVLNLVLTSRGQDNAGKVPMCGIPYHAADTYISRLIKAGLKVAICEQVEDPALAKGIVKRQVIRQVTTGTFIDEHAYTSRYLACVRLQDTKVGLSFTDTASGIIQANEYPNLDQAIPVIAKLPVYECLYAQGDEERIREIFKRSLLRIKNITLSALEDWSFNPQIAQKTLCDHFHTHNLKGFGLENMHLATASAGALLEYLKQLHRQPMRHIDRLSLYTDSEYVFISPGAQYGLELDSLFSTIDSATTALGKRKLKAWLNQPLKACAAIQERQNAVMLLKENQVLFHELRQLLHNIPDIEKSIARISCNIASFKDLLALRFTLLRIPQLINALSPFVTSHPLFTISDMASLREVLTQAINPDIPLAHPEGAIIAKGYHQELDALKDIRENGRQWLRKLQEEEIKRTKINSLKIGFNQVFGYYIEVSKANLTLVPDDYIRKQTLANAERFITPGLKEFEEKMLTAEEKILKLENELMVQIFKQVLDEAAGLHGVAQSIATIDCLSCLAQFSSQPGFCKPEVSDDTAVIIKDGRHPVVEKSIAEPFIPNDTLMDCTDNHLLMITGPNMAGKSTYIRQTAILVILAQMGSCIPASSAHIGMVDKIFTRIGAHDDITKGQSTFMVEMSETAGILNNLSPRSLVILDEIGRGTSTFDGLSLAWAVAEYVQKHKIRCLFATHFHELTSLAREFSGIKNYNVDVRKWNDEIIFLHKIVPGGTDDSYGIYVAKLAGIPLEVINRASHILAQLEMNSDAKEMLEKRMTKEVQLPLFTPPSGSADTVVAREIAALDINSMTPLAALGKLQHLKEILNGTGKGKDPAAGNHK